MPPAPRSGPCSRRAGKIPTFKKRPMAASFLPNFFPTPKRRQFNINPRYYDPEKERLEQLKKKYEPKTSEEQQLAEAKARISESFQRSPRPKGLLSTRKLLIFMALLVILLLWILR